MSRRDPARASLGRLLPGAAAFIVAELLAAIAIGGFFDGARAEPLLFLAFRPWLLLIAAAWCSGHRPRDRAIFYAAALVGAAVSETLFLLMLEASSPWALTLRGLAAGGLIALLLDLIFSHARRRFGRKGIAAAVLLVGASFVSAWGLVPYDRLILAGWEEAVRGPRPVLMVMTGLPIIWGEAGAFDPNSRPAESYRWLQHEFETRPLDALNPASLGQGRLLLLAQPRALAPQELVALDEWVRSGGRVLILADPLLQWPSALPLGDLRRPPPTHLLAPLLDHWGVRIGHPARTGLVAAEIGSGGHMRRLLLAAPGRIDAPAAACRLDGSWLADCRIGRGRALILADADLLHDELWRAAGENGGSRDRRLSDNMVAISELLDGLVGVDRSDHRPAVDWQPLRPHAEAAVLVALLPLLLIVAASLRLRRRG